MFSKYGKNIDMRLLNRNLDNIRNMRLNRRDSALKNLNEFNPNDDFSCPICESKKYELYVNIYGYQYCECQGCKSIFLANLPNAEELYVGNDDVPVEHYVDEEIFNKRKEIISKPKLDFVVDSLENIFTDFDISKIKSWLDIGCATGELLSFVKDMGIDAIGIESDFREVKFARDVCGLEIIEGYVDSNNPNEDIINAVNNSSCFWYLKYLDILL